LSGKIHNSRPDPQYKLPISAYIITFNEEKNIRRCLESLKDFAEIVIVDSFSTDNTISIAKEYTQKIHQHEWPGHTKQYVYALSLTSHEWVLWMDADEVAAAELLDEIRRIFDAGPDPGIAGYYIPRMTRYMGRWIRHGAWYPDYKLRLFKKSMGALGQRHQTRPGVSTPPQRTVVRFTGRQCSQSYRRYTRLCG